MRQTSLARRESSSGSDPVLSAARSSWVRIVRSMQESATWTLPTVIPFPRGPSFSNTLSKKLRLVLVLVLVLVPVLVNATVEELALELATLLERDGAKASTDDDRRNREHRLNVNFRMLIVTELVEFKKRNLRENDFCSDLHLSLVLGFVSKSIK